MCHFVIGRDHDRSRFESENNYRRPTLAETHVVHSQHHFVTGPQTWSNQSSHLQRPITTGHGHDLQPRTQYLFFCH